MDMDISTINESYHCGAGRFRVHLTNGLHTARRCTCSDSRMRGAIAVSAGLGGVNILAGAEELAIYRFNSGRAKHFFGPKCGHQARSNPEQFDINVASLLGVRPFDFKDVVVHDGVNHPDDAFSAKPRVTGHLKFIGTCMVARATSSEAD
jgi:hypothetical protein